MQARDIIYCYSWKYPIVELPVSYIRVAVLPYTATKEIGKKTQEILGSAWVTHRPVTPNKHDKNSFLHRKYKRTYSHLSNYYKRDFELPVLADLKYLKIHAFIDCFNNLIDYYMEPKFKTPELEALFKMQM